MRRGIKEMDLILTAFADAELTDLDAGEAQADIAGILAEMRGLRTQMIQSAERLGQLEKRLRTALREPA